MKDGYTKTVYETLCQTPSDINEHLPALQEYANKCESVVEFGVRGIVSTWAFMNASIDKLVSYDIKNPKEFGGDIDVVYREAKRLNIDFNFHKEDVREINPEKINGCDMLFIDTWHVREQLEYELNTFSKYVKSYIIMHDTNVYWDKGETEGHDGLGLAILDFLSNNYKWMIDKAYHNNNGLLVLKRR